MVRFVRFYVPEGGYAHESSSDGAVEIVATKNDQGVTVFADPKPFIKKTIRVKGVGTANFGRINSADTPRNLQFGLKLIW